METYEIMKGYISNAGYATVKEFAEHCGIEYSRCIKNMKCATGYKPSIDSLFVYATNLHIHVDELLTLFYPEEWTYMLENVGGGKKCLDLGPLMMNTNSIN